MKKTLLSTILLLLISVSFCEENPVMIFRGSDYRSVWNPIGNMKIAGDKLQLQGDSKISQLQLKKGKSIKNFILELEINFSAFGGKTTFGIDFRKSANSALKLDFNSEKIVLLRRVNRRFKTVNSQKLSLRWNEWYKLKLIANGNDIRVEFAGTVMESKIQKDDNAGELVLIGIGPAEIRNVILQSLPEEKIVQRTITAAKKDSMKIFVANGIYYHVFGTSGKQLKEMGASFVEERFHRHTQNGDYLTKEANSSVILPETNVVLLVNVNAPALNSSNFNIDHLEKFVRSGGGLVILGGQFSYGAGGYGGTALEKILPVETIRIFDRIKNMPPAKLVPVLQDHPILSGVKFNDAPVVFYQHEVNIKPGSAVVLNADGKPLLVVRRVGKGRVAAFLGTVWGDSETQIPYWKSQAWNVLLPNVLKWAAGIK